MKSTTFIQRGLSAILLVSYATTHVFAAAVPEISFWQARARATTQAPRNESISADVSLTPTHFSSISNSKLRNLLGNISLAHSTVQEIFNPTSTKSHPILLIQDIHLQSEAQHNITDVLKKLVAEHQINVVGAEGAFGSFDFSAFNSFSDRKLVQETGLAFLNKNLIAAPSYLGLQMSLRYPALRIVGVDDAGHHAANVQAFLSAQPSKERIRKELAKDNESLSETKQSVLSPSLQAFVEKQNAYSKGTLEMAAYLAYLETFHAVGKSYPAIAQFLEASNLEKKVNL